MDVSFRHAPGLGIAPYPTFNFAALSNHLHLHLRFSRRENFCDISENLHEA